MPRHARLRVAGIPFHVIQRGHNRAPCFFAEGDRAYYLDELRRQADARDVAVHAYVLMTNHVHLLMTAADADGIPEVMKLLGQRYVHYINRRRQRTGTLWQGRYRSCLVDSEGYLLTCHRYIELNPVRAKMVRHPREYRWSSYRANAEGKPNMLITPHDMYQRLARSASGRQEAYHALFKAHIDDVLLDEIRNSTNGNYVLGSERFQEEIGMMLGRRVVKGKAGRPVVSRDE